MVGKATLAPLNKMLQLIVNSESTTSELRNVLIHVESSSLLFVASLRVLKYNLV